ncbi:type VI secretion system protein TssA [Aliikangiella marina]|uniref:Type VI secretion system protein TssA n=1 Tax=Aliikangiella marina TaxID=1712262 RepID=A0A545TGQ1_9GAMM|nr:type VI secretion system protein TssA [Aliikangiella marina]TQV76414.1 type VI secretion system protein TssA [Aliikangiella marina]
MASPAVFDIDALLAPISEEQPTGTDIRENASADSPYYKIKDARNSARAHERSSMFEFSKEANDCWRTVLEVAPKILKKDAKDLEITSWYIEALIRLKGFGGLRDGFNLLQQLIEQYWENIYPLPDEDGIETTVAPLSGLNGQGSEGVLIAPIRRVPITDADDPGPFGFWQYHQALDVQKIVDENERESKVQSNGFGIEDIEKAVAQSSQEFFINQRDDLEEAINTYREVGKKLDELCGAQEAPSVNNIINTLQQCLGAVKHLGQDKFPVELEETTAEEGGESEGDSSASTPVQQPQGVAGPIQSREHAFKQLKVISEYFLKTEPHSPISYTLDKVIKWGDMSLTELISELIPDGSSRQHYSHLTGVKSQDD